MGQIREENAAAGKGEPVQLFWKADSRSIYPIDDGNTGKSFSFGIFNLVVYLPLRTAPGLFRAGSPSCAALCRPSVHRRGEHRPAVPRHCQTPGRVHRGGIQRFVLAWQLSPTKPSLDWFKCPFSPKGTMFAYGQTCSGKTFTMMGSEHAPGVIPLAMEDVFQTIKKVSLHNHWAHVL